jgi:hypothetical protein
MPEGCLNIRNRESIKGVTIHFKYINLRALRKMAQAQHSRTEQCITLYLSWQRYSSNLTIILIFYMRLLYVITSTMST